MSNKKLKYEKPQATDAGALSHVHGAECSSGFEAADGCNSTGNYAQECGFGYNNGLEPNCTATGNGAVNDCIGDGSSPDQACESEGSSPTNGCTDGSSPGSTPCITGGAATGFCLTGTGA